MTLAIDIMEGTKEKLDKTSRLQLCTTVLKVLLLRHKNIKPVVNRILNLYALLCMCPLVSPYSHNITVIKDL